MAITPFLWFSSSFSLSLFVGTENGAEQMSPWLCNHRKWWWMHAWSPCAPNQHFSNDLLSVNRTLSNKLKHQGIFFFGGRTVSFCVWFTLGGVGGEHGRESNLSSFQLRKKKKKQTIICTHLAPNPGCFVGQLLFGQVGKRKPTLWKKCRKVLVWRIWADAFQSTWWCSARSRAGGLAAGAVRGACWGSNALWHLAQAPSSAFGKKNIFKNTSIFIFCRQLDCASLMWKALLFWRCFST